MFRDLYAGELEYLYGLADELGREQSRIAPMLGRDADPGMSRLSQTVAFLSARLRQRLEDDLPDFIHPVIESLHPWLLRPIPSSTIVELVPDPTMKEPQIVTAGGVFSSLPIDGAPCVFRSAAGAHVRPWALDNVEIANERTELRFRLSLLTDAVFGKIAGPLRLFFAMPLAAALELRTKILRSTLSVTARAGGGKDKSGKSDVTEITLASADEPVVGALPNAPGIGSAEATANDALFALRSYFTWPEQFAFVDIPNLDRLGALGPKCRAFDFTIRFSSPLPKAFSLDPGALRLHCVPAVNVHSHATLNTPLVRNRCALDVPDAHVYAIEQVTLVNEDLSTRPVGPYARFFPAAVEADGRLPLLYRIERAPSVLGPELDVGLVFVDLTRGEPLGDASSVDVKLLVTDGERAVRVAVGELCVPGPASPPLVSFRNVTAVTRTAPAVLEGDRLWQWFALLKTPFWQLAERSSLARALALANVAAWARWPESKPGPDELEALSAVRVTRMTRPGRDEIFPGARVEIDLRQERFAGPGDVDLFGECLAGLFASGLREHEWVELVLCDERGRALYEYPSRFGTRRDL
jgi:type VI secretion system protein ImpG